MTAGEWEGPLKLGARLLIDITIVGCFLVSCGTLYTSIEKNWGSSLFPHARPHVCLRVLGTAWYVWVLYNMSSLLFFWGQLSEWW